MSADDRISPNGQAFANDLRLTVQFVKMTRLVMADHKAAGKAAKAKCKEFSNRVMKGRNRGYMADLLRMAKGQKPNRSYSSLNPRAVQAWVSRIEEQKALLGALGQLCTPEATAVFQHCKPTHGKPRFEGLYAETDPVVWCELAKQGNELLVKELQMFIEKDDSLRSKRFTPGELERKEGWFAEDRAVTWQSYFFVSEEQKTKALSEYSALFAALGAGMDGSSDFFRKREQTLASMRAEVESLASRWSLPPKGKGHYGVTLAKKAVKRWFKGAKVLKAHGTPGNWSIAKNPLGVPTHRSRFGWILFKPKGEPYCQLRTFFIGEDYAGGGKYQKDKDISFATLRWQACR